MSLDQLLFAAIKPRLEAATAIATTYKVRVGRDDTTDGQRPNEPCILYSPVSAAGDSIIDATFDLTIVMKRGHAFGAHNPATSGTVAAGPIDAVEDALFAQMLGWRPTLSGYGASGVTLRFRYRTTFDNPETITLRRKFGLFVVPGGSLVPLTGRDGTLSISGATYQITGWRVTPQVDLNIDHTEQIDTRFRYTNSDPSARVSITAMVGSGSAPFPVVGSNLAASFATTSGVSWTTESIRLGSYTWLTDVNAPAQILQLDGVIDNAGSPFFDGVIP